MYTTWNLVLFAVAWLAVPALRPFALFNSVLIALVVESNVVADHRDVLGVYARTCGVDSIAGGVALDLTVHVLPAGLATALCLWAREDSASRAFAASAFAAPFVLLAYLSVVDVALYFPAGRIDRGATSLCAALAYVAVAAVILRYKGMADAGR